jgi:hypothetical protein
MDSCRWGYIRTATGSIDNVAVRMIFEKFALRGECCVYLSTVSHNEILLFFHFKTNMASIETYNVNRYSLAKEFIMSGKLTVIDEGQNTVLIYKDLEVEVHARGLHHPIVALENLRKQLETKHQSLVAINGCRIDTDYRATGSFSSYVIEEGKKATQNVHMFEPTDEIEKLCTVAEHIDTYDKWLESVMPKE